MNEELTKAIQENEQKLQALSSKLMQPEIKASPQLTTYVDIARISLLLDIAEGYFKLSKAMLDERDTTTHNNHSIKEFKSAKDNLSAVIEVYERISYTSIDTDFDRSKKLTEPLEFYDFGRKSIMIHKIIAVLQALDDAYNVSVGFNHKDVIDFKLEIINGYKNLIDYGTLAKRSTSLPFYYEKEEVVQGIFQALDDIADEYKVASDSMGGKKDVFSRAIAVLKEKLRIQTITNDQDLQTTKKKISVWEDMNG